MSVRAATLLAALVTILAVPTIGLAADPVNQPNDPDFPSQWNFKGPAEGIDTATYPIARDPDNAMGINFTGAWKQGNVGRPDVLIAYIEGGVNYDSDNIKDGLDHVFLNKGELPKPEHMDGSASATYDMNGDGRLNVADYAEDPRANPPCDSGQQAGVIREEGTTRSCVPGGQHQYIDSVHIGGKLTPYLSPEDLIVVFSNHTDGDGNGYVDD